MSVASKIRSIVGASSLAVLLALPFGDGAAKDLDRESLGRAYQRAIELALAPETGAILWFRYSSGTTTPKRAEYIVNFVLEPVEDSPTSKHAYALRVVVREATAPVREQVAKLLEDAAGLPVDTAARRVKVRVLTASEIHCPAIREAFRSFSNMAEPALELDAGVRSFYTGASFQIEGYSESASFSIFADQGNALYRWAEGTYTSLELCAAP